MNECMYAFAVGKTEVPILCGQVEGTVWTVDGVNPDRHLEWSGRVVEKVWHFMQKCRRETLSLSDVTLWTRSVYARG